MCHLKNYLNRPWPGAVSCSGAAVRVEERGSLSAAQSGDLDGKEQPQKSHGRVPLSESLGSLGDDLGITWLVGCDGEGRLVIGILSSDWY